MIICYYVTALLPLILILISVTSACVSIVFLRSASSGIIAHRKSSSSPSAASVTWCCHRTANDNRCFRPKDDDDEDEPNDDRGRHHHRNPPATSEKKLPRCHRQTSLKKQRHSRPSPDLEPTAEITYTTPDKIREHHHRHQQWGVVDSLGPVDAPWGTTLGEQGSTAVGPVAAASPSKKVEIYSVKRPNCKASSSPSHHQRSAVVQSTSVERTVDIALFVFAVGSIVVYAVVMVCVSF